MGSEQEEQGLTEQRAGFRAESIPDATYRLDLEGNQYSYVVPWAEVLVGFSADELKEMGPEGFESRIHPEDLPQLRQSLVQALADAAARSVPLRYRFCTKDEETVRLREERHILRSTDGEPVALVGMVWSADPQNRALDLSAARAGLGIWNETTQAVLKDRDLRWAWCNARHAERLGFRPAELVGTSDHDFFPDAKAKTFHAVDRRLIDNPRRMERVSPFFVHEEWGELRQGCKAAVMDRAGNMVGLVVTDTDVTDQTIVPGLPKTPREHLSSSPLVMAVSADEVIRTWAPAARALFGQDQENARGMRFRYLLVHSDRGEVERLLRQALNGTPVEGFRTAHLTDAGRRLPLSLSMSGFEDSAGGEPGVLVTIEPLSHHDVRHVPEGLPRDMWPFLRYWQDEVFVKNRDLEFVYVNEEFANRRERRAAELIGKTDYDLFPEDEAGRYRNEDLKVIEGGQPVTEMKKWKSLGREIREVWTKVPLKDRQGRVAALLGVGSTPVEEHQAKRMITHWLSLVQCFAHPIIELTPDGTIGSWNPAAEQMYGYSQQEALGQSATMLAVPEERELLLDAVSRAGKGEPVLDCECRHRTKDGAEVYVSLTLSPILGLWGRQTGISVVARDISSRKQVEESLRYSAEEPRLLLSAWETEIFIKDHDLRIQFANEAYARKRGMTPEQLPGLSDYDLFDAELAAKFQQEDRRAMEAGEPVTERSVAVGPLGTGQYEKEQIKVPLKDGSGNVTGVLGIVQWPEQQRLAEEVVAHWASLVRSSDDAVIGVALDGTILSWNQGAEQVYGYTEDDAVGHSIELLPLEDASDRMEQALQQVAAGRSVRNYESEHRTKDGSSVNVAVTFSPVPDAEGEVSAVSIIARDITARKQAEQALQESEERFRLLAETAFDGISICEWDPAGGQRRLVYCNDRFAEMSGYSRQELEQADDLNALIEPEDTEEEGRRIRDRLRRGLPARGRASWNRPDGRENVYEWSAIRVEVGGKYRLFGVDRDITEHERAERQLEQYADQLAELNAELERSNRELQDFTHTVSHDLQEPLRKIHTFGQFLVEDCGDQLPDGGLEHLRRMQDAAVRMKRLISHLLDLARVGSRGGEMVPVDSPRVAAETVEMLSQAIEECGATVSIRGELPPVVADEVQLAQVLQNLISNALKFRSPQRQPRVEISAERDGQMVAFSIADNGIGIEGRFLDKIFGVFQRLYPRDQYEGAGVGLALCRKIVTRHGGRIWADSVPGEGTTVHFKLPAAHGRVDGDGPR